MGNRFIWPIIMGVAAGIMVGLSVSPVTGSVLGALLALVSASLAVVVGLKRPEWGEVDLAPVALFVFFLMFGSLLGIVAREQNVLARGEWLGSNEIDREIDKWTDLQIDRNEVIAALFAERYPLTPNVRALRLTDPAGEIEEWTSLGITDTHAIEQVLQYVYPISSGKSEAASSNSTTSTETGAGESRSVLYSRENVTACTELLGRLDEGLDIRTALKVSPYEHWEALGVISDTVMIQELVSENLCPVEDLAWSWE